MIEIIADYAEHIAEVYFPGRTCLSRAPASRRQHTDWTASASWARPGAPARAGMARPALQRRVLGGRAISEWLEDQVRSVLDYMEAGVGGADIVTTTSPFIARTVKRYFPEVEVRASVNMRIGAIKGMQYLADVFDSYHVQREHNRNLGYLRELQAWADSAGKRLIIWRTRAA